MRLYRIILPLLAALPLCAAPRPRADKDPETAGMDFKKVGPDRFVGLLPPQVKTVAILTPASKPSRKVVLQAAEMLKRAGLKVKIMPHALDDVEPGQRYLPLKGRLEDWNQAVDDPEVDMIICTRGGTGAQDLIKLIDWNKFKSRNLMLLGYSNITMLTGAMVNRGAGRPVTGPNLSAMVGATDDTLVWLRKMLAREPMPPVKLKPIRSGDAKGPVYGGHLKMLQMIDEGDFHVDTTGRVIFIECVRREAPELREYLEALRKNGFFDHPAAVVFCYFNRVRNEKAIWQMLEEFSAAHLKCPVYRGFPYGHKNRNYALDLTRTAVIRDDTLTFE